jgi:hypothetical protein
LQNAKIIILIVSMIGAIAGVLITRTANPPVNFLYMMVLFALFGVVAANLVLIIAYEISKG